MAASGASTSSTPMASGSGSIHEESGAEPVYSICTYADTVPSPFCAKMMRRVLIDGTVRTEEATARERRLC